MPPLAVAIGLSLLGSLGGLILASSLLWFPDSARHRILPWLVSYAVGAMLGAALLAILPEVLTAIGTRAALGTLLAGLIFFFVLETLVVWRHCHNGACEIHTAAASLVLISDALHNFVDGAVIGATVMTSMPLAVSAALAVAAHEIPQEVGDFAILLHAGYSRTRAFTLNVVSGLSAILGATTAFVALHQVPTLVPYVLSFAAAGFLYVALADLMPNLHRGTTGVAAIRHVLLVCAGILSIMAF